VPVLIDETLRDEISNHLVAAVERTPLVRTPFDHINFSNAFPNSVYDAMLAHLPPCEVYQPANMVKYARPDGRCSRNVADLATVVTHMTGDARDVWMAVRAALASDTLRRAVCTTLRVPDRGRPVSRLVHDLPGYWIEPHPDTRTKHVTMQFYLAADSNHEELGTTLYRLNPFRLAVLTGRASLMEKAGQFPFRPNTGYAFGVRWNSFHGVELMSDAAGDRHTLMNIYYRKDPHR
jgi:hypothetical protein